MKRITTLAAITKSAAIAKTVGTPLQASENKSKNVGVSAPPIIPVLWAADADIEVRTDITGRITLVRSISIPRISAITEAFFIFYSFIFTGRKPI